MAKDFSIQEFKPSILFLLKFLGLYFIGNIIYGAYIHSYYPGVDPVTATVTKQAAFLLDAMGWPTDVTEQLKKATAIISFEGKSILAVFEGCNGINVMIIHAAFLLAFGPYTKPLLWFIPAGLVVVHIFNLARIFLLFFVSIEMPRFMYFTHKYFFTAILYVVVFVMWIIWLRIYTRKKVETEK
jgi:exosortase family protein XrtF